MLNGTIPSLYQLYSRFTNSSFTLTVQLVGQDSCIILPGEDAALCLYTP